MRFFAIATFLCFWVSVIYAVFSIPVRIPLLFTLVWALGLILALILRLPPVFFFGFQALLTVALLRLMRQDPAGRPHVDSPGKRRGDPPQHADKDRDPQ